MHWHVVMRCASSLFASLAVVMLASTAAAQPDAAPAPPASAPSVPATNDASPPAPDAFPPSPNEAAPTHAEEPTPEGPPVRTEGMRLGLDLGFTRTTTARANNLTAGTPSLIPLGLDLSFRTSKRLLLGLHGSMALGSRDNCLSDDHCTARDYMFGGHLETTFLEGRTIVPWFRYGIGWEILYHGGSVGDGGSHQFRDALDIVDARIGADFIAARNAENGKTTRIGAYLGMIAGIATDRTGATGQHRPIEADYDSIGHVWLGVGLRATLDP